MRLYTVVKKDKFLDRILFNSAINANLNINDFEDHFSQEMTEYLENFLVYKNKEYMIDNCVCAFTVPNFHGNQVDKDEVVISFEADEKDVVLLNYDNFIDYADAVDGVTLGAVNSLEDEEAEHIKEIFDNVYEKMFNIENYHEALAVVENIPAYSIKSATISKDSNLINIIKNNQNKIQRHIPMQIGDFISISKVFEQIGYFQEKTPENKIKNFAHVENRKWIEGPENVL